MNAPERDRLAAEQNQAWLRAQFLRLSDALVAQAGPAGPAHTVAAPAPGEPAQHEPALTQLARQFGLSPFETDTLLLAAGFELDQGLRAALHSRPPSFALALALLPDAHWDALSPQAPLRRWDLLRLADGPGDTPLAEQALRVDERVLHALTCVPATDPRLDERVHPVRAPATPRGWRARPALRPLLNRLRAASRAGQDWISHAPDWPLAAAALHSCGLGLQVLPAADLPAEAAARHALARGLAREVRLSPSVLGVDLPDDVQSEASRQALDWLGRLQAPVLLRGPVPKGWWARVSSHRVLDLAWPTEGLGPATPGPASGATPASAAEAASAAVAAQGSLAGLARTLVPQARLSDLVLPPTQTQQLAQIVRHLRQRQRVLGDWGFARGSARGLGLCALFTGESGTGKTLAAEAIAQAAGQGLCAIDLAQLVSKYIGETEKNLARVFDAAEASGAVLLFDEADALFGKRSEVRDSHDRYANLEVSYLLQRIEAYQGLAVLTTNLRSALDRAFLRRIQFVVQFPFPDADARARLWQRQWPEAAPVGELDTQALARLSLSGGHIRSAALSAAYEAADAGSPITHALVLAAAHAELAKLDRPTGATR